LAEWPGSSRSPEETVRFIFILVIVLVLLIEREVSITSTSTIRDEE